MLRVSFEAMRARLFDIYGTRETGHAQSKAHSRVQLERYLQKNETVNRPEAVATAILARYWSSSRRRKQAPAARRSLAPSSSSASYLRKEQWRLFGLRYPHFFVKMLKLPKAHITGIGSFLADSVEIWTKRLQNFLPTDVWTMAERLPVHAAAARSGADSLATLRRVLGYGAHGVRARDHLGRLPLHVACANETDRSEEIVEALLDLYPIAAHAQDHAGMLPLHHATRSSGPCASSVAGRLISVFPCGPQTVDDWGRLPIDYTLGSSSANVGELVKAVARAFVPGCRVQDADGDNAMHRICRRIRDERSDAAMRILQALLDVKVRPNLCSLLNAREELAMHVVAACPAPVGADAVNLLAEAYLPACWTQVSRGGGGGQEGGGGRARRVVGLGTGRQQGP